MLHKLPIFAAICDSFMHFNFLTEFHPVLFQSLKTYSRKKLMTDLMSGLIVGVVALPLAIATG